MYYEAAAGERAFPQGLARRIMVQLAGENGWPVGWAYDGRSNMYAPAMFLATGQAHEYSVKLAERGGGGKAAAAAAAASDKRGGRTFRVVVRHVASLDMRELDRYVRGETSEMPRSVLQVLDIVLRHGVALRTDTAVVGEREERAERLFLFRISFFSRARAPPSSFLFRSNLSSRPPPPCIGASIAHSQPVSAQTTCPRNNNHNNNIEHKHNTKTKTNKKRKKIKKGASVYFYSPQARGLFTQLGRGTEAWAGYKQAVKICRSGLTLNLDMAATAFLASGPLGQLAADLVGMGGVEGFRQGLRPPQARALREALRGVRILVQREGQEFRKMVRGLSESGADRTLFR